MELLSATATGLTLGLAAGMGPGPLMTLAIRQTMQYGVREGLWIAVAPLATDIPIILIVFFALRSVPLEVLGVLSLCGGAYAIYLSYETFTARMDATATARDAPGSLRRGIIANFLNPSPYLFWATVGVPFLLAPTSGAGAWGLVPGFYVTLVGAKALIAVLIGKYRVALSERIYVAIMRVLAVALIVFAAMLVWDGLGLLGFRPD